MIISLADGLVNATYDKPKKRKRNTSPVFSHPKKESMTVRILNLIEVRGGMKYSQIVKQLFRWAHPDEPYTHSNRGYWASNLCGGRRHKGILATFCMKVGKLWMRNSASHNDSPWSYIKPRKSKWSVKYSSLPQPIMVYAPYTPLIIGPLP